MPVEDGSGGQGRPSEAPKPEGADERAPTQPGATRSMKAGGRVKLCGLTTPHELRPAARDRPPSSQWLVAPDVTQPDG